LIVLIIDDYDVLDLLGEMLERAGAVVAPTGTRAASP
jgi:hypothetical protein